MLAQRPDSGIGFTRRDLVRLIIASGLLIVTLTAILAVDVAPSGLGLQVGAIAQSSVRAPRSITYESKILTARARAEAADAVAPQYDFSAERAANVAAQQGAALTQALAPADAIFTSSLSPVNRADLLQSTLPGLSDAARPTLITLSPERWRVIRNEAARVLDEVERSQLRDTDLATQRQFLGSRVQAGLSADERQLATELIGPFVVANSSYSESLTQEARDTASVGVAPVTQTAQQGQVIVDAGHPITVLDLEIMDALGINASRVDGARLAGWALLAVLLVGLLLAWVWRFRPELWHRNTMLLLVGLMLAFATLALNVTAGRSILPFFVPTAAAGMLLAILLDAGAATVLMAVLAVIAGAVNGSSPEFATYVFLGGLAGIIGVRRGDRLHVFVQAGFAVAVVNIAVVSTFVLLGERALDLTGVLQLWAASVASGMLPWACGAWPLVRFLLSLGRTRHPRLRTPRGTIRWAEAPERQSARIGSVADAAVGGASILRGNP